MSRGGVRRGRKNDPALLQALNTRIDHRTYNLLKARVANDKSTLGQAIEMIVREYVDLLRAAKLLDDYQPKENSGSRTADKLDSVCGSQNDPAPQQSTTAVSQLS